MKHQYNSSNNTFSLHKLIFLTLLVGLIYAGMFYAFTNQTDSTSKSSSEISQIISVDSLVKEKLTKKVISILPSRENTSSTDNSPNDRTSYQENSHAFKFLGAIFQLLLNLYRL